MSGYEYKSMELDEMSMELVDGKAIGKKLSEDRIRAPAP